MSKKPPLLGSDIPIEVVNAVWDDLPEEFRSSRIYGPYGLARYWLEQNRDLAASKKIKAAFKAAASAECDLIDQQIAELRDQRDAIRAKYFEIIAFEARPAVDNFENILSPEYGGAGSAAAKVYHDSGCGSLRPGCGTRHENKPQADYAPGASLSRSLFEALHHFSAVAAELVLLDQQGTREYVHGRARRRRAKSFGVGAAAVMIAPLSERRRD